MTRDEIDELITYLEKNYHVKCSFHHGKNDFDFDKFVITPNLSTVFTGKNINKETIINHVNEKDLIRF